MSRLCSVLLCLGIAFAPVSADGGIKWPWKAKSKPAPSAKVAKAKTRQMARVERDLQRLESLLASTKTSANLSRKAWKSVANEASALASRIHANVKSATTEQKALRAADELRGHVQRMKKDADQGDYRNTRRHAARALTVATRLDQWAG
jgi:hypothetical protein